MRSTYTPLGICTLFPPKRVAANSTTYLLTRGTCNIPQTANALALIVQAINPSANGQVRVFESSLPLPEEASFDFRKRPGNDSAFLVVRLCYPQAECAGEDLAVHVNAETGLRISVVGFYEAIEQT